MIDSGLNELDDGIQKPDSKNGSPLQIRGWGADGKVLAFTEANSENSWQISQQKEGAAGLNISTAGQSKLFIERDTGTVAVNALQYCIS